MFAIVNIKGSQYQIEAGEKIRVAQHALNKVGDKVVITDVLLIHDKDKTLLGKPFIAKAQVETKVVDHGRAEKILVYKMKAKKRYARKQGHRQNYTTLEILDIKVGK
jgi:large subunit ribosomal protein L21